MNSNVIYVAETPNALIGTISYNQVLSTGSQIMITMPAVQGLTPILGLSGMIGAVPFSPAIADPDLTKPRTPGLARGRILRMAADFDAPVG